MGSRRQTTRGLLGAGPFWPLLAFLSLTFASIPIQPHGTSWRLVGVAAALGAVLLLLAALAPWTRLPLPLLLVPALGAIVVLALLRHSGGGSTSGYGPLALLPVAWVALVAGRRTVLVLSIAVTSMFALPILIFHDPMYPSSGWRSATLYMVVSTCVGLVVTAVVAEQRQQAAAAAWQADQVAETLAALESVAGVARDISSGADARELVCAAAYSSMDAVMVTLIERENAGFRLTGAAGIPVGLDVLQQAVEPSASLVAFFSQERVLISDVSQNAGVSPLIIQSTGLVSVLFEPIVRRGMPVGVLGVGWATTRTTIDPKTQAIISFLAAEAGSAIERSDLLARLDEQARTDELTSMPNRRAWDDAVEDALRGNESVCVAMLDIDHFKIYNDEHGHPAGDRLLQQCTHAWSAELRPGDLLARYGGEEFAVLLRGCALVDAQAALERLRRATPIGITCSLGVAQRRAFESGDELMARADAALYGAKRAGRNRLAAA
jgi:diguanylate cyclase (GGDEF)-like protein